MKKLFKIGLIMQGWSGGIEYIKNIVLALNSLPSEIRSQFEIIILCKNEYETDYCKGISSQIDGIYSLQSNEVPTIFNRIRGKIIRGLGKYNNDPRFMALLEKTKVDFIYPLTYADFGQYSNHPSSRKVVWIPDFQHKYLPHFFTENELISRETLINSAVSMASTVVLSSYDAKNSLEKFYPTYSSKVKVLQFASTIPDELLSENPLEIQQKYNLPDKFLIVSNQFFVHKNHPIILKALSILKKKGVCPNIIFTGHIYDSREPHFFDGFLQEISKLGLQNQVYLLGLLPRYEQLQIMRLSIAVIQPSLFEGWSTVIEDAKSLGKNLIASDLDVHLEQSPSNCRFFDRSSAEELALHMGDCWSQFESGLDLNQEKLSISDSISRVQKFGYQFLSIAGVTLS